MTDLVVRRLLIDLETPFTRHWCGGDAFRSALFNALSMSFPIGEQFFIDAVKNGLKTLPSEQQEKFRAEVQGFIGQEATRCASVPAPTTTPALSAVRIGGGRCLEKHRSPRSVRRTRSRPYLIAAAMKSALERAD